MSVPPISLGKSLSSVSTSSHGSAASPAASTSNFEHSTRRPVQQTGAATPSIPAAPRKGQGLRKQHRNQKRPAAGGTNNNNFRYSRPDDDDAMAEARILRNTNSRRGQTSITHLLNYAVPSRVYLDQTYDRYRYSGGGSHSYRSGGGHHHSHHHHHVDKARFVHANYRFVVNPMSDYKAQAADADEYINWIDVLQILASAESQATACPICLSEPVAPRMAKCGHIFCLPCLIRFMNANSDADELPNHRPPNNSSNNSSGVQAGAAANANGNGGGGAVERKQRRWKKCPICEDSIYLADLCPVRFYAGQESPLPRPGDDVVLRLMMRHANSIVALPREGGGADVLNTGVMQGAGGSGGIPWHFAANVLDYARVMKGTGDYMVEQFDRELEELERQEKEDELLFHEDNEWTQKAMRSIRAAQATAKALGGLEVALLEGKDETSSVKTGPPTAAGGPSLPRPAQKKPDDPSSQDFFFYMSPPHLYLSPLDIRILKTKYGSFSQFPSTLLPRVEHLSTGHVVDDALRRRAKYLGHLPAGCVVSFLECDWTDIVPADILSTFAEEIERRRKRNRDKAAQEEREHLQAERLEAAANRSGARRIGGGGRGGAGGMISDGVVDSFDDDFDRPAVDITDFMPLGADQDSSRHDDQQAAGSSPSRPRPGFGHLATLSTSPPSATGGGGGSGGGRTVWGTPAVPTSPGMDEAEYYNEYMPTVDDGWLRDEQVLGSLVGGSSGDNAGSSSSDLAAQLAALGVESSSADSGHLPATGRDAAPAVGSRGKKKKKQKITLMSTGGRRGN